LSERKQQTDCFLILRNPRFRVPDENEFRRIMKIWHDVKPRVAEGVFARRFGDADAQTKKLSPPNTIWKKPCRFTITPEFDPRKTGGKGGGERAVCAKHRSRGISSQPANPGTLESGFALQLERAF
jgi:hypothetical protein